MTRRALPAYVMVVLCLAYAAGKAVYAAQGRLGLPTGPVVSPEEHARYARDVMAVSLAQWMACGTGLLGAAISLATVTRAGRRMPRPLMVLALLGLAVGAGAGAVVFVLDGFIGLGVGWQWPHGVLGIVALAALALMVRAWHTDRFTSAQRAVGQQTEGHGTATAE